MRGLAGKGGPGKAEPFGGLAVCWRCFSLFGLAVLAIGFVLPIAILAIYSFFKDGRHGALIADFTFNNYLSIISDRFYLQILLETVWLGVMVASICALLAYPVAYHLTRTTPRVRGALIFMVLAPLTVSVVIRNLGWFPLLSQNGVINSLLMSTGLINQPLMLMNNFVGVLIGLVHALLPLMIMMLTNVFQRVSPQLEEAANNLGSSRMQLFLWVLLPLTLRGLAAGFLLVFTIAISSYTTPALMGGQRVLVMATFIDQQVHQMMRYASGSALAVILLIVALSITIYSNRQLNKGAT